MRFVFGLQPLLEVRLREEGEKLRALARARETRDAIVCTLERCTLAPRLDAHLRFWDAGTATHRRRLYESERAIARAAQELLEVNRARRALEMLKERRREAFEREEQRRDEREIEEANER